MEKKQTCRQYCRHVTTHLPVSDCGLIVKRGHSYGKALCIDLGQLFTKRPDVFTEGLSVHYQEPGASKSYKGASASPCLSSFARMTLLCLEGKETSERETRVLDRKFNNFIMRDVKLGHACVLTDQLPSTSMI